MPLSCALLTEDPLHPETGVLERAFPGSAASTSSRWCCWRCPHLPTGSRQPRAAWPCPLLAATPVQRWKLLLGPGAARPSQPWQPCLRHCHTARAKLVFTEQRFAQVSPWGIFRGIFSFFFFSFIATPKFPPTNLPVTCLSLPPQLLQELPHLGCSPTPGRRWESAGAESPALPHSRPRGSLLKIRTWCTDCSQTSPRRDQPLSSSCKANFQDTGKPLGNGFSSSPSPQAPGWSSKPAALPTHHSLSGLSPTRVANGSGHNPQSPSAPHNHKPHGQK